MARDHATGVLLTVDELHYVAQPTLEALVMGLHRASQLRLPITVAGAGLPSLATLTGEAKSYAERMFTFPLIGSLDADTARARRPSSRPPTKGSRGGPTPSTGCSR